MSSTEVSFISSEQALDLRMRILRPLQPREACIYAEDNNETTFHLGIIENEKVISNGTIIKQAQPQLPKAMRPYRLRGMATDNNQQKKGLGRKIILAAEVELKKRNCDLLWFNARVSAEGFYKKLGYAALEEIFNIDTIGPHKIMYKWFK
jgi:predicted GNAT family N-acyltransferase